MLDGGAQPEATAPALLWGLALRVREVRENVGLSRRELAEKCGLSERFLAMVEAGQGNVSVLKLDAVARALGTTASVLLAAGEQFRAVEDGISEPKPPARKERAQTPRLALLGLRGAGKSSIGARAAAALGVPHVELDARIAARAGMPLAEIFDTYGQVGFRKLEREELERVLRELPGFVLAPSGSIVTDSGTYELLRRATTTIWLRAKAEDHWDRVVAQGDARPMANRQGAMRELRALLRARSALYERADHAIDTSKLGFDRAVERVVRVGRQNMVSRRDSL